jgi:hypothetical protein
VWNKAKWTKEGKEISGSWSYCWSHDIFDITLDGDDEITGRSRKIEIKGDSPEFNGWKLVREKK